ncbi:hypothetical protein FRY98_27145 [Paenibacillus faecis]|uniref:Uncharacterized protein n=1 Tax=Paenibacillus faecis TaxID=862114 RepID=A0A5D0CJW8_9BACL|nr:hypothetical protein [Paenibacillus faecis]TYA10259.1 hypothetical protein FRY98_27145 [Paenibacillus faecis]
MSSIFALFVQKFVVKPLKKSFELAIGQPSLGSRQIGKGVLRCHGVEFGGSTWASRLTGRIRPQYRKLRMRRTPSPQRFMGGTWPGWMPRRGGAQKMQICRNFRQIVEPSYKLM